MSYLIIRIYSFECDAPGCEVVEEGGGPYITDALKEITAAGWKVRKGKHYCPAHGHRQQAHEAVPAVSMKGLRMPGHALRLEWSGERGPESSSTGTCKCGRWEESASSQRLVREEYQRHIEAEIERWVSS